MAKIEVVSSKKNLLPMGGYWDEEENVLLHTDSPVGEIWLLDIDKKKSKVIGQLGFGRFSFVVPFMFDSRLVVIMHDTKVKQFNLETREQVELVDVNKGKKDFRINFGKCDNQGRLLVADMQNDAAKEKGSLYSIDANLKVSTLATKLTEPMGICWNTTYKTMYLADAAGQKIYSFDYDDVAGTCKNQKEFLDFTKGTMQLQGLKRPTGCVCDESNNLWISCVGDSEVFFVRPPDTTPILKVHLPAKLTTSICWGGEELDLLLVTTALGNLNEEEKKKQPTAGLVYKIIPSDYAKGILSKRFAAPPKHP